MTLSIWCEPTAGTVAVGLRLAGLPRLIGYQGAKWGYADAILHHMGLVPGSGVDTLMLADISPGWQGCWRGLAQPGCAHAAGEIVEAWRDHYGSDAPVHYRACWDEQLAIYRAKGIEPTPMGVARWLVLIALSAMQRGPDAGPAIGYDPAWKTWPSKTKPTPTCGTVSVGKRLMAWPEVPPTILVWDRADLIPPTAGAYVMFDPPYENCQGYESGTLSRSMMLHLADRWAHVGATCVGIMEGEAMPGYDSVDLTIRRKGTTPHWGRSTKEILSLHPHCAGAT